MASARESAMNSMSVRIEASLNPAADAPVLSASHPIPWSISSSLLSFLLVLRPPTVSPPASSRFNPVELGKPSIFSTGITTHNGGVSVLDLNPVQHTYNGHFLWLIYVSELRGLQLDVPIHIQRHSFSTVVQTTRLVWFSTLNRRGEMEIWREREHTGIWTLRRPFQRVQAQHQLEGVLAMLDSKPLAMSRQQSLEQRDQPWLRQACLILRGQRRRQGAYHLQSVHLTTLWLIRNMKKKARSEFVVINASSFYKASAFWCLWWL